jgi:hypothetical protein
VTPRSRRILQFLDDSGEIQNWRKLEIPVTRVEGLGKVHSRGKRRWWHNDLNLSRKESNLRDG